MVVVVLVVVAAVAVVGVAVVVVTATAVVVAVTVAGRFSYGNLQIGDIYAPQMNSSVPKERNSLISCDPDSVRNGGSVATGVVLCESV